MIRFIVAAAAMLAACQPATKEEVAPATATPTTGAEQIPASYDWTWRAHGGSADLDFGDGDWAEGVSLLHFSCLPNSQKVEVSWDPAKYGGGTALVSSSPPTHGGSTRENATWAPGTSVPADHPVLVGFRATGRLEIGQEDMQGAMQATPAGKKAVKEFFAYCTTPLKG